MTYIQAKFPGSPRFYTFMALKGHFRPGEHAVAETANGLAVVAVGEELEDYKPVEGVQYRFIFQVVDTTLLEELKS